MLNIYKIRPKSTLRPVKAIKFLWCMVLAIMFSFCLFIWQCWTGHIFIYGNWKQHLDFMSGKNGKFPWSHVHWWASAASPLYTCMMYRQISNIICTKWSKFQNLNVFFSRHCTIHRSQMLSREWRCSWSSADRWCSNYIWVIKNWIAHKGATYIREVWQYVPYA